MSLARHYLFNVLAQGASRTVSMGASFAVFVLFARVLGAAQLGELAFLMAFVLLAGVIAEMGTTAALAKDLTREKDRDPEIYLGNYLILRAILAVAAIVVAIPFAWLLRPDLIHLLLISCVAVPFVGARVFESVYQIYERPQYSIYAALFLGVTQLSVASTLLLVFKAGLAGYMYGFVATQLAYFIVAIGLAFTLVKPRFVVRRETLRSIVVLAAPMGVWSIFNAISTRADIFMLSYWRTTQEVGIYNAAYRLLDLATAVAATVAVPLVPVLTKKFVADRGGMNSTCSRALELTVLFSLPVPLVLPFVAEPLLVLLYGESFRQSAPVLQVFAWVFLLVACLYVGSAINLAAGNIRHAWWNAAVAACLNLGANFYLIPRFGVIGAAWASAVSMAFMLGVSQCYVRGSVGNVFVGSRWARILLAAAVPYTLMVLMRDENRGAAVIVASLAYIVAVVLLRLLPLQSLVTARRTIMSR